MVNGDALSQAVLTTFITSGSATLIATLIGVPLGAWCARQTTPFFARLKTLVTALYGLPPVVVGVFVYAMLSKSGTFGSWNLLFTVQAMIVAQTILIFPWSGEGRGLHSKKLGGDTMTPYRRWASQNGTDLKPRFAWPETVCITPL